MTCMPQEKCGDSESHSSPEGLEVKMAISCCSTDNSIPNLTPSLKESSVPHGKPGPSGSSKDSTKGSMQCTEDEKMWRLQMINMSGAATASTAARGCVTKTSTLSAANLLTFREYQQTLTLAAPIEILMNVRISENTSPSSLLISVFLLKLVIQNFWKVLIKKNKTEKFLYLIFLFIFDRVVQLDCIYLLNHTLVISGYTKLFL